MGSCLAAGLRLTVRRCLTAGHRLAVGRCLTAGHRLTVGRCLTAGLRFFPAYAAGCVPIGSARRNLPGNMRCRFRKILRILKIIFADFPLGQQAFCYFFYFPRQLFFFGTGYSLRLFIAGIRHSSSCFFQNSFLIFICWLIRHDSFSVFCSSELKKTGASNITGAIQNPFTVKSGTCRCDGIFPAETVYHTPSSRFNLASSFSSNYFLNILLIFLLFLGLPGGFHPFPSPHTVRIRIFCRILFIAASGMI